VSTHGCITCPRCGRSCPLCGTCGCNRLSISDVVIFSQYLLKKETKMKAIIICEREGWTWRIEPQDGEDSGGVDIVYTEDHNGKVNRTCIGSLDDAEALAKAIKAYVEFARKND